MEPENTTVGKGETSVHTSNSVCSMLVFGGVLNNLLIRFLNIALSQGSSNYIFVWGSNTAMFFPYNTAFLGLVI